MKQTDRDKMKLEKGRMRKIDGCADMLGGQRTYDPFEFALLPKTIVQHVGGCFDDDLIK